MRAARIAAATLGAVILTACAGEGGEVAEKPGAVSDTVGPSPATSSPAASSPAAPSDSKPTITPDGIGAAQAGRTLAEIRASLEPGWRLGEIDSFFMVDLAAIPVIHGLDTLYHLVYPADEEPADTTVPLLVVTDHPRVRTAEGVGPGTSLAEAAAAWGAPRLSYSVHDEMREYARFPRYTHAHVHFRLAPGEREFLVGRYEPGVEYGETDTYDEGGHIMMVMIELRRVGMAPAASHLPGH